MLDNSKARNGAISLVLSLIIALGGLYIYGRLREPEFTSKMVMQEEGEFSALSLICLTGLAIVFTSGGVVAFKKKDIR